MNWGPHPSHWVAITADDLETALREVRYYREGWGGAVVYRLDRRAYPQLPGPSWRDEFAVAYDDGRVFLDPEWMTPLDRELTPVRNYIE